MVLYAELADLLLEHLTAIAHGSPAGYENLHREALASLLGQVRDASREVQAKSDRAASKLARSQQAA